MRREYEECARVDTLRGDRKPLVRGSMTLIESRQTVVLSCPFFLTSRSEAIGWVAEAYEWREVGALGWNDLPVFARRAVTAFARGVSARRAHEFEEMEKERERKEEKAGRGKRCSTR